MADSTVTIKTKNNIASSSPEVTSKTPNTSSRPAIPAVVQGKSQNVLNRYRSFTYNFVFSGLRNNAVRDTSKYEESIKNLTIFRSGGKGADSLTSFNDSERARSLVEGFNKNSPGKFDFFMDNVEINNIISFNENSSVSLPTKMDFEVFEPYSINGFIEALQTVAVAAGYSDYLNASYILKVEFIGYPDNVEVENSTPEIIPNSSRYFVLRLKQIGVEITERGTAYKCEAIPFHETGFGQSNTLVRPVSMSGSTVQEILKNLMDNINEQVAESNKSKKDPAKANKNDRYEIKFHDWDETTRKFNENLEGEIPKSKISELTLKDNKVFKFINIGDETKIKDQTSVKYTPTTGDTKPIVQFAQGQRIHECIAAVIRDSDYLKNILKTIGQTGNPDDYGMIRYFMIRVEVTNQDAFDEESRKPYQTYTYIVSPFRVHYTRIPGFNAQSVDDKKLSKVSLREYNYIYTGQNVDILDFKLNFNTLFYEAIPYAMANNEFSGSKNAAGKDDGAQVKQNGISKDSLQKRAVPAVPVKTVETNVHGNSGPNSGQIQDDPYYTLARSMHDAIVNSKASLLTGEMKILGDPFFLVTGGIGNENQTAATATDGSKGKQTDTGEAFHLYGEVLITINFRNPIDISKLEEGGLFRFEPQKVPFSGVYRINEISNSFRGGIFTQILKIMRIPGQILDTDEQPSQPSAVFYKVPDPLSQVVPDTTPAQAPQARASGLNLLTELNRGLPGLSNFTAAAGGLGGSASALLNQVSGAVKGIGVLGSSLFGSSIPGGVDQLASGIRLQKTGLLNGAERGLSGAALVSQAANTLNTVAPSPTTARDLASTILSNSSNVASDISASAISAVSNAAGKVADLANNIGNKITTLQNASKTDPAALAKKFGIDPSQLSGLTADLQSKVLTELNNITKKIPANVDIEKIPGLAIEFIGKDKLANLPATPVNATAPNPPIDAEFFKNIKDPKQIAAAFGVTDISKISGSIINTTEMAQLLTQVNNPLDNPLKSVPGITDKISFGVMGDKLNSVQKQINAVVASANSVESNLKMLTGNQISTSVTEKFGSLSQSPLAKFMTASANSITGPSGG
jgi:hypothetical protein